MERYAHVISEFLNTPWAIDKRKLEAMQQVLLLRAAGQRFSVDEIHARIGATDQHERRFTAAAGDGKKPGMIAVLPVYGVIANRMNMFDDISGGTSTEKLTKQFRSFVANADVKTIVLDFDSPGGSVYGVEELAQEIFEARDKKRIVAQVNPLCASAAYYLAASAHEVVITPSGECGSIGVYCAHQDISKMAEMMGVKVTLIDAGKYKTEGNEFEPLSDEARTFMQSRVNDYYDMFVDAVAQGRGVKAADVRKGFGEGRVLGAAEAVRVGLADRIATFDQTIERLTKKGASVVSSSPAAASQGVAAAEDVPPAGPATTTATADNATEVVMETGTNSAPAVPATNDRAALAASAAKAEQERANKITLLGRSRGLTAEAIATAIAGAQSYEQFATEIAEKQVAPVPVLAPPAAAKPGVEFVADEHDKLPKGISAARLVRAVAISRGSRPEAVKFARETLRDYRVAANLEAQNFAAAGFLIGENMSSDFIDVLRPASVVRSLNPTLGVLVGGVLTARKRTGSATASYIGESAKIPVSKPKGGHVRWTAKKLVAMVALSNDLLRAGNSLRADEWVRDDMVQVVARKEDISFIRSLGTEYTPTGLRYHAPAANVIAAQAAPDLTKVTTDLGKLRLALKNANVPMLRCGFIFTPRTENYLMNLRDGNGNFAFRAEMLTGKLDGHPYRTTTQIPDNLGGGGNESEIYFADFSEIVIADAPTIGIEFSTEASYDDGTGTQVSTFQNDEALVRVIEEHDLKPRHAEAIAVLTGVIWI